MTRMGTSTSSQSASGADPASTRRMSNALPLVPGVRAGLVVAFVASATLSAPTARATDPSIGDCLTAAETSLKLRAEHKLRLTRTQLLVCSASSCPGEVRQECMRRIDELNAASPTIVLVVKDRAGRDLSDVKVTADGQAVADHLDGSALSIDPGPHEFTFTAGGAPPLTETIILHEGEKDRREMVNLAVGAPPAPAIAASTLGPGSEAGFRPVAPGAGKTQRALGLLAGSVGIAGLAVGGAFGALASSSWKTAQRECPDHTGCTTRAMDDRGHAVTEATVSTVGFIAGGVLFASGVGLYLTAPGGGAPRVGLEARPGGLAVSGEF
jgi:hypothetical protein